MPLKNNSDIILAVFESKFQSKIMAVATGVKLTNIAMCLVACIVLGVGCLANIAAAETVSDFSDFSGNDSESDTYVTLTTDRVNSDGLLVNGNLPESYNYKIGFTINGSDFIGYGNNANTQENGGEDNSTSWVSAYYRNNSEKFFAGSSPTGLLVVLDAANDGIGTFDTNDNGTPDYEDDDTVHWTLGDDDVLYTAGDVADILGSITYTGVIGRVEIGGVLDGIENLPAYSTSGSMVLPSINLITGVPEPATLALLGTGLTLAIFVRRRKSL